MRSNTVAPLLAALATALCVSVSKADVAPYEAPAAQSAAGLSSAPSHAEMIVLIGFEHTVQAFEAQPTPVRPKMARHEVIALVDLFAREHGVPVEFARAVVRVESSYKPEATGSVGEIGLMQLKFQTARLMGFRGSPDELYVPVVNLNFGMKYLAGASKLGRNTPCGAVIRYQGGHARKTHTSVSPRYCEKVRRFMASAD